MNSGAAMPESAIAFSKAAIVSRDRSARAAFSRPAFSRSRRPMRPRSDEQVMTASGSTAATSSAARFSWLGSSGEKIEEMATDFRPLAFISPRRPGDGGLVERHERPAVIFVAAFHHPHAAAHQLGQVLRPVAERRQRGRGRHAEPERRDLAEVPALDHGVDEMRGADHHAVDALARKHAGRAQALQRIEDARGHVLAGRRLHGAHHLAFLDQDGVGVGAAHVNANASHASNTLLKSMS